MKQLLQALPAIFLDDSDFCPKFDEGSGVPILMTNEYHFALVIHVS